MQSTDVHQYSLSDEILREGQVNYPPPLVRIGEAPKYLPVSRSKMYELVADGELTRVHIGSRAFITGGSITAFLDKVLAGNGAVTP